MLTPQEAGHLFRILRSLADAGKTIVLVTHKLREIMAATDRVSVMRRGAVVADLATRETDEAALAELMVGRKVDLHLEKPPLRRGAAMLEVAGLRVRDAQGGSGCATSTSRPRGEIVGVAGIAGNGQSELLEALAGLLVPEAVSVRRRRADATRLEAGERRRLGIGHIPEDRLRMGLVPAFTAADSAILGDQREGWYGGTLLRRTTPSTPRRAARCSDYDIRPPDPRLRTRAFSGGNQQKLVCAREMERHPKLLLVGQPTRGVDIGAIEFIHRRLLALRDAGCALLLVSVELDEIRALADRILVMADGAIVGAVPAIPASRRWACSWPGSVGAAPARHAPLPAWADYALLPLLNLAAALVVSGLVILAVGESPLAALATIVDGVFGDPEGIGYTLYYATTFIFTGLAVAIPFHAGLFNIGGEGQA